MEKAVQSVSVDQRQRQAMTDDSASCTGLAAHAQVNVRSKSRYSVLFDLSAIQASSYVPRCGLPPKHPNAVHERGDKRRLCYSKCLLDTVERHFRHSSPSTCTSLCCLTNADNTDRL